MIRVLLLAPDPLAPTLTLTEDRLDGPTVDPAEALVARPSADPPPLAPVEFWPWRAAPYAYARDLAAGHAGAFGSSFASYRAKNRPDRKRAKRAEQKAARRKNRGR